MGRLTILAPRVRSLSNRVSRGSIDTRIRGNTLQKIRREHFAKEPLCVTCKEAGRVALATELDHITPLFKGGRDAPDNRQGLCWDCHNEKTITERGHTYKPHAYQR